MIREARDILRQAGLVLHVAYDSESSWFRDLIMFWRVPEGEEPDSGPSTLSLDEKLDRIGVQAPLPAIDTSAIACSKQRALMAFVKSKRALGLTPTDGELQAECCKILDAIEVTSNYKCKGAVSWFKYLIKSETGWLRGFRQRAGLPRSSEMISEQIRSLDAKSIDYSIHNEARLEKELKDWVKIQMSLENPPSDDAIQRQARLIVYKNDDQWNQTAVDSPAVLHLFKRQVGLAPTDALGVDCLDMPTLPESPETGNAQAQPVPSTRILHWDLEDNGNLHWDWQDIGNDLPLPSGQCSGFLPAEVAHQEVHTLNQDQPSTNTHPTRPLKNFFNDAHCYGRLVRALSRFVTSCMSPNNPNQHVSNSRRMYPLD